VVAMLYRVDEDASKSIGHGCFDETVRLAMQIVLEQNMLLDRWTRDPSLSTATFTSKKHAIR